MIDEVLVLKALRPDIPLYITGGGAYKYKADIEVPAAQAESHRPAGHPDGRDGGDLLRHQLRQGAEEEDRVLDQPPI